MMNSKDELDENTTSDTDSNSEDEQHKPEKQIDEELHSTARQSNESIITRDEEKKNGNDKNNRGYFGRLCDYFFSSYVKASPTTNVISSPEASVEKTKEAKQQETELPQDKSETNSTDSTRETVSDQLPGRNVSTEERPSSSSSHQDTVQEERNENSRPRPRHKRSISESEIEFSSSEESLESKIPRYSDQSIPLRETMSARRSLIYQQNKAYEESLKADEEKERKKAEEKKKKEEQEKAEMLKKQAMQERKLQALENLPEEPSDQDETIIIIAIRFPSGATVKRNFRPEDTLLTLRNFLLAQDETPFDFNLVRYPNEVISINGPESDVISLQQYGFKRKEVLYLQDESYDSE